MAAQLRAVSSVAGRQLRITRRYPVSTVNLILLGPVFQLVLPALLLGMSFLVAGQAVGLASMTGTDDLAGWLFIGMAVGTLTVSLVWGAAFSLNAEREQGTLEHMWACPVPRETVVLGAMLGGLTLGGCAAAVLLVTSYLFSARYSVGMLVAPLILVLLVLGLAGYAYLAAGLILAVRQASDLLDGAGYVVMILSGAAFPVALLPLPLQAIGYALPTTWAIDLLRYYAVGSMPIAPVPLQWVLLTALSLLFLLLGRGYYRRVERRLCADGTTAHH